MKAKSIKNEIIKDLLLGGYKLKDRYLSQNELLVKYKCTVKTIFAVLKELSQEGYIERRRGVGTFVGNLEHAGQLPVSPQGNMIIVCNDQFIKNSYWSMHNAALIDYCTTHNRPCQSILFHDEDDLAFNIKNLSSKGPAACIIYLGDILKHYSVRIIRKTFGLLPLVYFDGNPNSSGSYYYDTVIPDYRQGGRLISDLLLSRGIFHFVIAGSPEMYSTLKKIEGIYEGIITAGLKAIPDRILCGWGKSFAYTAIRKYLTNNKIPQAIICLTDEIAQAAYNAVRDVEKKIIIAGIDITSPEGQFAADPAVFCPSIKIAAAISKIINKRNSKPRTWTEIKIPFIGH